MKRRTLIAGVGSLVGGVGTIFGSSAFGFIRADRELSIVVEHDNDAYLGLRQLGAGHRSSEGDTPEQVRLDFPGLLEGLENPSNPQGLGKNSVYEFTSDADGPEGLIEITNQGTNDVEVYVEQIESDGPGIEFFDVSDDDREALSEDNVVPLGVGEAFRIGVRIETFGIEIGGGDGPNGEYLEEMVFVASEQS